MKINAQKKWLVTGCAGFIGSHLIEELLKQDQKVVGVDNFLTGFQHNLDSVKSRVGEEKWSRFKFFDNCLTDRDVCLQATEDADYILHQAALGSVPRSIKSPIDTFTHNVVAFQNLIDAARINDVSRFVFASSSSVYGDDPTLPKEELKVGTPLSPYAVSKKVGEIYAQNFNLTYRLPTIGLRYFNVFGPRQNPQGAYAAVIPKWIELMKNNAPIEIYGDGKTSRDFSFVSNVVDANLRAAHNSNETAFGKVFNIACGDKTSLNQLFQFLAKKVGYEQDPIYKDFRPGDILHSLANTSRAEELLGYTPLVPVAEGLGQTVDWFLS